MVYVIENFSERRLEWDRLSDSGKIGEYEQLLGSHVSPSLIWTDKTRMLAMIDWMLDNEFPYIASWWKIQLQEFFPENKPS